MGASLSRCLRLALFALTALPACRAKIGDGCLRSTDCSIRGERVCDLSHRVTEAGVVTTLSSGQGECTIDGCGRGSCPKEAACVKVYGSDFLTVACDPEREDLASVCEIDDGERRADDEAACAARGCQPPITGCEWLCTPGDGGPTTCCGDAEADACRDAGCRLAWTCPPRDECQANEVCLPEGLCADEATARTSCRRKCKDEGDCRAGYECVSTGSQGVYQAPDVDDPNDDSNVRVCMPER